MAAAAAEQDGPSMEMDEEAVEGLTFYEMNREPMKRLPDDVEVTVPLKLINSDFRCPVCLGILRNTHATKECLHRFCGECIQSSLRLGKKECPSCRMKCASRRSLRPDTNFDALVKEMYPNLKDLEAREAKLEEQIKDNRKALSESLEKGLRRQEHYAKFGGKPRSSKSVKNKRKADEIDSAEPEPSMASQNEGLKTLTTARATSSLIVEPPKRRPVTVAPPQEIEFVFTNHPDETELSPLEKRYLKTTSNCTVQHLCKYLDIKLGSAHHAADYQITLSKNKAKIILPPYFTLKFIVEHYWKMDGELVLHYSLKRPAPEHS